MEQRTKQSTSSKKLGKVSKGVAMITFEPLWRTLKSKELNKGDLQKLTKFSSATIAKLAKNENVTLDVVDRICKELHVPIYDVVDILPDDSAVNLMLNADR